MKRYCVGPPEYGLNIPAGEYSDEGVRFLRTTDIGAQGGLAAGDGVFVPNELALDLRHQLLSNDLLFSRSGSLGRCLRFDDQHGPATFAGYLVRFRPGPEADSRFLAYCAQSKPFQSTIEADAVTSTISNFNAERYASINIPYVALVEQRAIADYLDAETARIDALIAKKQQLIHLLEERLTDFIERRLFADCPTTRLDRLTDPYRPIMYGIVLPGPDVGEGVPIVKGGNVRDHQIGGHVCHTTVDIEKPYARARLAGGDLVVIIRGAGAGRVAGVEAEHADWNITQDVARVAPGRGVDSRWLRHVLEGRPTQEQLRVRVGGAAITGINIWDLKRIEVPAADLTDQAEAVREVGEVETRTTTLAKALANQIRLLAERRQALITAAVTGEFAVPGAA